MTADRRVPAAWHSQLAGSTTCSERRGRFAVVKNARRDDPGLRTARNPGNVGLSLSSAPLIPVRLREFGAEEKDFRMINGCASTVGLLYAL
jgi:hypothetical protein